MPSPWHRRANGASSARDIVRALKGDWHGSYGIAKCPVHDDQRPSLSISQKGDRVLWHCHAGCDQRAVGHALHELGACGLDIAAPRRPDIGNRNIKRALAIWQRAVPLTVTSAEIYLRSRCIWLRPDDLRYDPDERAMIAAIRQRDGQISGIQRTFLTHDGRKAERGKRSLGAVKGGCVQLGPVARMITLAEGVENALAFAQMTGRACWAVCGATFMGSVDLPQDIGSVVIAADNDRAGAKAADVARKKFTAEGRDVRVVKPPIGLDWNDILFETEERLALGDKNAVAAWGLK